MEQQKPTPEKFEDFESLPAVADEIERLIRLAGTQKGGEKRATLRRTDKLIEAYNEHTKVGGNAVVAFRKML